MLVKNQCEYYSSVDKKVDKRKIRNLKGELNNYSGRLHNLQKRFDEIFYGFPLITNIPSHLIWKIVILEEIFPQKFLRSQCIYIYHSKNQNLGTIQSNQEFQPNKNSQDQSPIR